MKESNRLFELIKAMNSAEKGYFKKYSFIHSKAKEEYIRLFDILSSQEKYDEKSLVNVLGKNLASKKIISNYSYLYKLILKSLRAFHSDVSFNTKTMELLLDSVLLKQKGLFDQSNKTLNKAKESAIQEEDIVLLLKIHQLQRDNNAKKPTIEIIETNCQELYPEMLKLTAWETEEIEINQLHNRIHLLYLKYGYEVTKSTIRNEIEEILNNPLLDINRKYATRELLYLSLLIRKTAYNILGDFHTAIDICKIHLSVLEKDPRFNSEHFKIKYGLSLCNLLDAFFILDIKEIEMTFNKILLLKPSSLQHQIHFFNYSYGNMMGAYIHHQMPKKGIALIPEIIKKLKEYKGKMSQEVLLVFQINISTLYFMIDDFANALKWMNKTLENLDKEIRKDIYSEVRILNILIHYELKNFQLIDSLLVSLERYLIKNKTMDPLSKVVIYHLKKLLFIRDKKEINDELLLLKSKLTVLLENQKDKKTHILSWIEKKLLP